jgi:hypothetical protein
VEGGENAGYDTVGGGVAQERGSHAAADGRRSMIRMPTLGSCETRSAKERHGYRPICEFIWV